MNISRLKKIKNIRKKIESAIADENCKKINKLLKQYFKVVGL